MFPCQFNCLRSSSRVDSAVVHTATGRNVFTRLSAATSCPGSSGRAPRPACRRGLANPSASGLCTVGSPRAGSTPPAASSSARNVWLVGARRQRSIADRTTRCAGWAARRPARASRLGISCESVLKVMRASSGMPSPIPSPPGRRGTARSRAGWPPLRDGRAQQRLVRVVGHPHHEERAALEMIVGSSSAGRWVTRPRCTPYLRPSARCARAPAGGAKQHPHPPAGGGSCPTSGSRACPCVLDQREQNLQVVGRGRVGGEAAVPRRLLLDLAARGRCGISPWRSESPARILHFLGRGRLSAVDDVGHLLEVEEPERQPQVLAADDVGAAPEGGAISLCTSSNRTRRSAARRSSWSGSRRPRWTCRPPWIRPRRSAWRACGRCRHRPGSTVLAEVTDGDGPRVVEAKISLSSSRPIIVAGSPIAAYSRPPPERGSCPQPSARFRRAGRRGPSPGSRSPPRAAGRPRKSSRPASCHGP